MHGKTNLLDKQYQALLQDILDSGARKSDRTGTGTYSVFGATIRHDMREGFPLLTTKKMFHRAIVHELLWMISGSSNVKYLVDNDVHIWDEWPHDKYNKDARLNNLPQLTLEEFISKVKNDADFADEFGELGPVYGRQWRRWNAYRRVFGSSDFERHDHDQLGKLINDLKTNPDSRRLMVSAWNPSEVEQMTLPPCHYAYQCWTRELERDERVHLFFAGGHWGNTHFGSDKPSDEELDKLGIPKRAISLMFQMRSVDMFLGYPFDIASYGLLLSMIAQVTNMVPEELISNLGDTHIYSNHLEAVNTLLKNKPYELCQLKLNPNIKNINDFRFEDIQFENYKSHATIKAPIAV
jgi:thymidylate synthase